MVRTLLRAVTANTVARAVLVRSTHTGLVPSGLWKRLPVEARFRVMLPDGRFFVYSATADDGIGRALYWRGLRSWEAETTLVFYRLARSSQLVLDIGANTGVFTLLAAMANPESKVIAFEPVSRVYNKLMEHIELNRLENRCQAQCVAVSDTVGATQFHVPFGDMPTSASLNIDGFRGYEGALIQVPVTTIDAVLDQNECVDLVKIDVEGFEDQVLKGMQRTLSMWKPAIVIECNYDGPFQAINTILSEFGYRFFHLVQKGPVAIKAIVPDPAQKYRNFLCLADERSEQV